MEAPSRGYVQFSVWNNNQAGILPQKRHRLQQQSVQRPGLSTAVTLLLNCPQVGGDGRLNLLPAFQRVGDGLLTAHGEGERLGGTQSVLDE
jgi:hypothetical protein